MYDVVIIGAGVIGSAIARELGKYQLDVLVLEKEDDIAMHTSKANSGIIHTGYDCRPGTLKAQLNVAGSQLYPQLAKELNIPYRQIGSLVLAHNAEEEAQLQVLLKQGQDNGVESLKIISRKTIHELEPYVDENVTKALYAPNTAIVCPYETALALAQNAAQNGVAFNFEHEVKKIIKIDDHFIIDDTIKTRYIVNAAGLYSDVIAAMLGDKQYTVKPRKGEYLLLDKNFHNFRHVLFQVPTAMGKGVLVVPTVDGNTLVGPTAIDIDDKDDDSVTAEGIATIQKLAGKISNAIDYRQVITEFSGIRAVSGDDFHIYEAPIKGLINLIGIASPGLASSPAIALYVLQLLQKAGIRLLPKNHYDPRRNRTPKVRELDPDAYAKLVAEKPLYGKIVCRCETVSEQEVIDAITGIMPATSLDGVKRRTRAGMGRCQGGFCSVRIMELLHIYQKQDMLDITKAGRDSNIVVSRTKGSGQNER